MVKVEPQTRAGTFSADFSVEHVDDRVGNGHAETEAAVTPIYPGIGLFERSKKLRECIGRHADSGIVERNVEAVLRVVGSDDGNGAALVGELDGVAKDIP
ncbi:MAG: hypothetical protein WAN04_07855 [Candidatus Udaeobacter sp.]